MQVNDNNSNIINHVCNITPIYEINSKLHNNDYKITNISYHL